MADRAARRPLKIPKKTFDVGVAMLLGLFLKSTVNTFFE
jgi:hypothetical protein